MSDIQNFDDIRPMNSDNESETKNKVLGGTLYLVATPIGNLADMSARALKVLSQVDFIAAEDTRNSNKLLSFFGISKPMVSYFEHNKSQRGEYILSRLKQGESCALITDAGTPAISDPGEDIVRLCADNGIKVSVIPGCSACVSALSVSGLSTSRFTFEGFLPVQKNERKARLSEIEYEKRTMIFYEAPHKLRTTLSDMAEVFGEDRRIALCRELTKLNEEVIRLTLGGAIAYYEQKEPRGEYVLVIEGSTKNNKADNSLSKLSEEEHVQYYEENGLGRMDAIKAAAKDRGITKSELYKRLI